MQRPVSIITLDYPLELPEGIVTELTMRRPTLRDEMDYAPVSKDPRKLMREEVTLLARLCGMKSQEFDGLDMVDYEKLQKEYLFFRTGERAEGSDADGGDTESSGESAPGLGS